MPVRSYLLYYSKMFVCLTLFVCSSLRSDNCRVAYVGLYDYHLFDVTLIIRCFVRTYVMASLCFVHSYNQKCIHSVYVRIFIRNVFWLEIYIRAHLVLYYSLSFRMCTLLLCFVKCIADIRTEEFSSL